MAGSNRFRKSETCPNCKERIVHECGRPEQDEAVRLTGEALYRTYWHAAVANSQDWPTQWERLSHPTRAVWDSFAAALATPATPAALDVERIDKYLHDEGVWTGDNEEDWHRAVCEGIARLSTPEAEPLDIDQLQQDGAQE